jgi:hypothetical protein
MTATSDEQHPTPQASIKTGPKQGRRIGLYVVIAILLLAIVAGLIFAIVAMIGHPGQTETIRDIVIIFMAMEMLIIGLTLVVLIIQLARLTTLIQTEIRPILDSTSDTVNTLRGTTRFLSNNLVKPVMKANSTAAAFRQVLRLIGIGPSDSK